MGRALVRLLSIRLAEALVSGNPIEYALPHIDHYRQLLENVRE